MTYAIYKAKKLKMFQRGKHLEPKEDITAAYITLQYRKTAFKSTFTEIKSMRCPECRS